MKATAFFAVLAVVGSALAQAPIQVNTPAQLVTCQPAALTWSGGVAPYFVSVLPGGQVSAVAIETFPTQQGTSYTWPAVNVAAGTSITIQVRDSTGSVQYSSPDTIQPGPDTSCVGQSLSGGSSSTAAGSSPSASASAAGSTTKAGTTAASPTSGSPSTPTSATSAAATTTKSAAAPGLRAGALSVAGIAGLIGAALL